MAARRTPDQHGDLVAAAQAVASWAHMRRATWTTAPLPRVRAASPAVALSPSIVAIDVEPPIAVPAPLPAAVPAAHRSRPSVTTTIGNAAKSAASVAAPAARWIAWAAAVVAAGAALFVGAPRLWRALPKPSLPIAQAPTAAPAPSAPMKAAAAPSRTGNLEISSTPDGARVLVDGKMRGVTPLSLADVAPGRHEITIESSAGAVHRTVTVAPNQTVSVDESIFSGWVVVYAPFEVVVSEGGRVMPADERNQVMLSAGPHQLRISNRRLAYDVQQRVEIKPGEISTIRLTPEPSLLTVTSSEPAEVWVDGARFGDTPLQSAPVSLGTHQVVVKRVTGGEKRMTITAGVNPITLNVDFK